MTIQKALGYYVGAAVVAAALVLAKGLVQRFSTPGQALSPELETMIIFCNSIIFFIGVVGGRWIGGKLRPITVRTPSLILAALYVISGILMYITIPAFLKSYTELVTHLPLFTRAVLFPRPIGWLLIGYVIAGFLIFKDKGPNSRFFNALFLIILGCGLALTAFALFLPMVKEINKLSAQ